MAEKYEPSRREICAELWCEFKDLSKKIISGTGKSLKEFGSLASLGGAVMVVSPYAIPTAVRVFREIKDDDGSNKISLAGTVGAYIGLYCGLAADTGQVFGYAYVADRGYPEAFAIPIATNVISGVYELGRKAYKNARQNVVNRHNESVVNSSNADAEISDKLTP